MGIYVHSGFSTRPDFFRPKNLFTETLEEKIVREKTVLAFMHLSLFSEFRRASDKSAFGCLRRLLCLSLGETRVSPHLLKEKRLGVIWGKIKCAQDKKPIFFFEEKRADVSEGERKADL